MKPALSTQSIEVVMPNHYREDPIDVIEFDRYFRRSHNTSLNSKAILTGFSQSARRWKAVYQEGDVAFAFEGEVKRLKDFMRKGGFAFSSVSR